MWTLIIASAMSLSAEAACETPASSDEVAAAVDRAEIAYGELDVEQFRIATDEAVALVSCVDETITKPLAARLHRFEGLRKFIERDLDGSKRAFAAARSIEPAYTFPTSLVPEGNPVRDEYIAMDPSVSTFETSPPVAHGYLMVDGTVTYERPKDRPAILQVLGDDGTVLISDYLGAMEPLPVYEIGKLPSAKGHPLRLPLAASAGGLAIVTGVFYGLAASEHSKWEDPTNVDPADIAQHRQLTNSFFLTSVGTGIGALGLGAGAVFVAGF